MEMAPKEAISQEEEFSETLISFLTDGLVPF